MLETKEAGWQELAPTGQTEHPLRILFAVHTPWTERLGVPRVSIELTRHLEMLGHRCEKYSQEDSGIQPGRLTASFTIARFQRRLLQHIRQHGHKYDVIQAEHTLLPFRREAYRFSGTLIAKSNGLAHFYDRYASEIEPRLRRQAGENGTVRGNLVRWLGKQACGRVKSAEQGFRTADQVHLLNQDELAFVREKSGCGDKCVLVPNGLSEERAAALAASATPEQRAESDTVAFIGTWSLRKGKLEFPRMVRQVREQRPQTRFRLIGTFADVDTVRAAFDPQDREHLEVVPQYEPGQLPNLLADAHCGLFPSYIEGFPLGLLEMLAAGLPAVAWDVPGPREMLRGTAAGVLVAPGETEATASAILEAFSARWAEGACEAALQATHHFRWTTVTEMFLAQIARRHEPAAV